MMKRSLALLLALLMSVNAAAAVSAEEAEEIILSDEQVILSDDIVIDIEAAEETASAEEAVISDAVSLEEAAPALLTEENASSEDTTEPIPEEEPVEEERPELEDTEIVGCTAEVSTDGELLTGELFGTDYWGQDDPDVGDRSYNMAFDGDISTFYDAYDATIDAHVGMNVVTPTQLTEVHIVPRNANGYEPDITVIDGSGGYDNEDHSRFLDRDLDSVWCQEFIGDGNDCVTWQTSRPVSPSGYQMYTGYDTEIFPERNPISWTLYATNDPDGEWDILDQQADNYDIPDGSKELYEVYLEELPPQESYEYFKLQIDAVEDTTFQLGEFRLLESAPYERMEGMTIQGSTDGKFWANLYTFPVGYYTIQPYVVTADEMDFVNECSFTQFRVVNTQQHFNVAEVEFYGVEAAEMTAYPTLPEGEQLLNSGAALFGTDPWEEGSEYDKAFDGDTDTYYDAYEGSGSNANVGISLDTPAKLTGVRVYPRADWAERLCNLTIQGSVSGNNWITLYHFPDVVDYGYEYYEITEDMLASAAQEYAFTQFRVINKADHLNVAEIEFYGTYEHDLDSFPTVIAEPIYSYLTGDQFVNSAYVYYERDPETEDDDHYMDWWYFNERDEEDGMTRFEREFEGREPIVLIGGVGFDGTVLELSDIDGKPIIAVAPFAFAYENGIREVVIDENSDCKYIMSDAFAECSNLESVTVSNSLRDVVGSVFRHCWNLSEFIKADDDLSDEEKGERDWGFVEVVDGVLIARGSWLICYPPAKEPVDSYRIPDSVNDINNWAFVGAQIGEITMGHNVIGIHHGAFADSTVNTIILSPNLRYLGNDAFAGCTNLTYLEIPSDKVEIDRWRDYDEDLTDGAFMFTPDMFANTNHDERTENLVVRTYEGNMIHEYINYIQSLEIEDYDMSHVVFEEETETYWYGGDWFGECGENEVFLLGYSAPLDAEITTMPTETYDGKTIIGIRTDGDAWQAFCNDSRVGGSEGTFTIPEGIRYIFSAPFADCENLRTLVLPDSLEYVNDAPFSWLPNLEKFVVSETSNYFETRDDGATLYGKYYEGDNYDANEFNLEAFALASGMTHVDVAEGTDVIHGAAFENSQTLRSVTLPDSLLAIDWWAFKNSTLESITIPASVDRILPEAFMNCASLTEVKILRTVGSFCNQDDWPDDDFTTVFENSPNVTVYVYAGTDAERAAIDYGWPYETFELEATEYETYTANDGVHLRYVLAKPGDTYFTIPEDVQVIDDNAFAGIEGIETVVFPKNLRYIGHEAFAGCGDQFEIIFSGIVQLGWEGSSFDNEEAFRQAYEEDFLADWYFDGEFAYILAPSVQEAWIDAWWYTAVDENGVMNVPADVIVDGVKYDVVLITGGALSEYAPRDRIGDGLAEEMGLSTEWTYPKSIVLPETIRCIGEDAFAHHYYWDEENEVHFGLESVTLPRAVKWIEHSAFNNSGLLTKYDNLDAYGAESGNPYRLMEEGSIVNVWDEENHWFYAYPYGKTDTEYTVPDSISGITVRAFSNANNLVSVTLSEGVRWLDDEAFAWCDNLETISLPSTLEDINHGSFRGCDSLTEILLPEGNDRYFVHEDGTLRADEGETIAVLPLGLVDDNGYYEISEGVKGIWSTSMASQRLTELVIPDSMEWMNGLAFEDCGNLRKVTFNGTFEDNLPLSAFAYCHNLEEIVYYGDYVNMFVHDYDIDDRTIATEHDEEGNVLHDENGNRITRKFNFRLMNADADATFFIVNNDDWEDRDYDTYTPDDNPYFTLIRGISETVYGDVDGDGEVTETDALYLLRYTLLPERYPLAGGDHNYDNSEDGAITAKDAAALMDYVNSINQ